jgi:hypothetical protein
MIPKDIFFRSCWAIIFAIILSSLGPTISQAISIAQNGNGFAVEICTLSGPKMVQVDTDFESQSDESKKDHCSLCSSQASSLIQLVANIYFSKPVNKDWTPTLFYQASKPIFAWLSASPRAPPQIS